MTHPFDPMPPIVGYITVDGRQIAIVDRKRRPFGQQAQDLAQSIVNSLQQKLVTLQPLPQRQPEAAKG